MKKVLLSLTALALFFAACKKDDNTTEAPVADTPKLITELRGINPTEYMADSIIFTYNDKNEPISSFRGDADGTLLLQATYENGKITKITSSENGAAAEVSRSFVYNTAGKLLKAISYYDGETSTDSLTYDANGKLLAAYRHYDEAPVHRKDAFVWEGENMVASYAIDIVDGKETDTSFYHKYTFDTNKNFQPAATGVFFLLDDEEFAYGFSANNIITSERVYPAFTVKYTSAYTYDKDMYPVTYNVSSYNDDDTVDETEKYTIKYNK